MVGKRIRSIERVGKRNTYDVSVIGSQHNFMLANGVISHNSGKSWTCLRMAEILDPEFSADRIIFDLKLGADMIARPEEYGLKQGSVLVFEEAGVGMNAREFATVKNRVMGNIMQTFRHLNLIVFFNSPNPKFVDVNLRRLIHSNFQIERHDNKYSYGRFDFNVPDHQTGEVFRRKLIFKNTDLGQCVLLSRIKITAPSVKLRNEYERRARAYKLQVAGDARERLDDKFLKPSISDRRVVGGESSKHQYLPPTPSLVEPVLSLKEILSEKMKKAVKEMGL
jgi:hypothetical protein